MFLDTSFIFLHFLILVKSCYFARLKNRFALANFGKIDRGQRPKKHSMPARTVHADGRRAGNDFVAGTVPVRNAASRVSTSFETKSFKNTKKDTNK